MHFHIKQISWKGLMISKAWVNRLFVIKCVNHMLFQYSTIEKLIFVVDKPNVMIDIVSCPNDKVRIFSINDVFKSSERSSHWNITSSVISPITCACVTFDHSFFLSTTRRFRAFTVCPLKITSVYMRV